MTKTKLLKQNEHHRQNETTEIKKQKKKANSNKMNAQRCQVLRFDCDWLGMRCRGNLRNQINK